MTTNNEINYKQEQEDEIDLLELFSVIWAGKKFITIFSFSIAILTAIISLFMTNIYRAESTVMPVTSGGGGGMLGDLAGMVALAGMNIGARDDNSIKISSVDGQRETPNLKITR